MDLLVAYGGDPAGLNMAQRLTSGMKRDGKVYHGGAYDMVVIDSPAVSADWLESEFEYDGYVFLSRHSAESGRLALTCHTTGNFGEAALGGNPREVAVPHAGLQKAYMRRLWEGRGAFGGFEVTLEATHHGPTALCKPSMFVEVGTTDEQWNDVALCGSVADILREALGDSREFPTAVGFGGTHYPSKFTREVVRGRYALGTIVPKRAVGLMDESLLSHVLSRNVDADTALLDWDGMGPGRRDIERFLEESSLEVVRV